MPVFPAFVLAWWTVGVAAVANFTVAFVWTIELTSGEELISGQSAGYCPGKWKIILGMSMQFTWPLARGFAVAAANLWPSWSGMLQVVSAPSLLSPLHLNFHPESPRWLLGRGRVCEARSILTAGARRNKRNVTEEEIVLKQPHSANQKYKYSKRR